MASIGTQERATLALLLETAGWTGEAFPSRLVARLGERFGAALVLAGRLEQRGERWIHPAAVAHRDRLVRPSPYRLRGTPCELVVDQGPLLVRDRLAERFPDDAALRELQATCYVGQPIRTPDGATIGVLAALFDQAGDPGVDEATVLEICAARLAAEFLREDAQHALRRRIADHQSNTVPTPPTSMRSDTLPTEHRDAHVLLADGDDLVRRACHRSLRPLGARLMEAHCADRLVELLDATPATHPLVVLVDAHLPSSPLPDLLLRIRQRHPAAQVLLMTGLGDPAAELATTERRIAKPFSAVVLRVEVGRALEASRAALHPEPVARRPEPSAEAPSA